MNLKSRLATLATKKPARAANQKAIMTDKNVNHPYSPFFPPGLATPTKTRPKLKYLNEDDPRKPDWLILLISALVLLTLLIAWVVDIPGLFNQ